MSPGARRWIVACAIGSLVLVALLVGASRTYAAPDPLTCAGYPEPRTFVDENAWWSFPDEAWPGHHIHVGACFPNDGVVVKGSVGFDIRVLLHSQPAGAKLTRVRIQDNSTTKWAVTSNLPQPDSAGNLTAWFHATLNLSGWSTGRHELRFGAYVSEPDGSQQIATGGWQLAVNATTPRYVRSADAWTEGRSWYSGVDYTNARILSRLPLTNSILVQCAAPSGKPVTRCVVAMDMNSHAGDPGTILHDSAGPWKGYVSVPSGHKLAVLSSSRISTGTATGVITVNVP